MPQARTPRAASRTLRRTLSVARAWFCLGLLGCGGGDEHEHDGPKDVSTAGNAATAAGMKAPAPAGGSAAAGSGAGTAAGSGTAQAGSSAAGRGGSAAGSAGMSGMTTAGMMASGMAGRASMGSTAGMTGGTAGTGMMSGGTAGTGGMPSAMKFSFFMTSQAGLAKLAGNDKGFGGDLRFGKADGLSGADEICRKLAETTMPNNNKTWRAFLSVTKGPDGMPVHAIDRVGNGPWYDRVGRMFAANKAALLNVRPMGADPLIIDDFPNEEGVPNHNPGTGIIDNHNTLTGSDTMGRLDAKGLMSTCQDWTSSVKEGGKPRCGVSWPRASLTHWISTLNEGGCAPGSTPPGAEGGPQGTVGALGGYGGFYCFALTP